MEGTIIPSISQKLLGVCHIKKVYNSTFNIKYKSFLKLDKCMCFSQLPQHAYHPFLNLDSMLKKKDSKKEQYLITKYLFFPHAFNPLSSTKLLIHGCSDKKQLPKTLHLGQVLTFPNKMHGSLFILLWQEATDEEYNNTPSGIAVVEWSTPKKQVASSI